ncbi:hypothetical protein F1880_004037 [Penicillium rolfsii]|nr:hypothetical protein F1880_004037 [Penicillium rolfsii]
MRVQERPADPKNTGDTVPFIRIIRGERGNFGHAGGGRSLFRSSGERLTGSHDFSCFYRSIHSTFFFSSHSCIFRGNHSSDADPGPLRSRRLGVPDGLGEADEINTREGPGAVFATPDVIDPTIYITGSGRLLAPSHPDSRPIGLDRRARNVHEGVWSKPDKAEPPESTEYILDRIDRRKPPAKEDRDEDAVIYHFSVRP